MIVLFEENETKFTSLGLGILSDPISCFVKEGLNDNFELEMVYPITGKNYSKIKIDRIIFTKPNPYDEEQPYRIISITKPINGKVTVSAVHISYDTNGIPVAPIKGGTLSDAIEKIQNGSVIDHDFKIYTDIPGQKSFTTNNYYNLRALLMGGDNSLMNVYEAELSFDKFKIYLNKQRGQYRGAQVRYAKNMKDLSHVISYEKLYNGVYPFYHQETTETTTNTTSDGFKQVYIVGNKPFQDGWLSYTAGGEPYHPVDESPVQIGSDGDYKDKVYCWNTNLQRYQQKKYNEMVTVIEGVMSPEWIFIDWSALPTLTCRAKVDGYFKMMTDTEWTFVKANDIVFQGSFKNVAESLIIYYSEVIPNDSSSEVTETENVVHVELDDKIIWLDTDGAKNMKHNRILMLDLTSEFDEAPDKDALETKAKEYIEKNKLGKYKYETRVSFVDLSRTTEGVNYEGFDKVLLGDIVKVIYEDIGVDVELRVTSTKYDVLKDAYDSIDLGEKPEKMSSSSIQNGDDVSALVNDVGYTDVTTVNKLVAKIVTADFIKAKDAELSKASIEQLSAARINCTGIIEASQFALDTLIAKLLIADNAQIKETLEAGTVKVNGDITISKGSINIKDEEKGTVFNVDREGNVKANSVEITGGSLNINNGIFEVGTDGILHATGAVIQGEINAQTGSIAGFNIVEDSLYNNIDSFTDESAITGIYIGLDGIRLGKTFSVDNQGNLKSSSADLTGKITATSGYIGDGSNGFTISSRSIWNNLESMYDENHNGIYIGTDGIRLKGSNGEFKVDSYGKLTATSADLTGKITATSGYIGGFAIDNNGLKYTRSIEDSQLYKGEYSDQSTYNMDDIVKLDNHYYSCLVDIEIPEEFDPDKWDEENPDIEIISVKIDTLKYGDNFVVTQEGVVTMLSASIGARSSWGDYITLGSKINANTPNSSIAYISSNGRTSAESGWASSGFYIGNDGLAVGSNFVVTQDGVLTANSAVIQGRIDASSGMIGDFEIKKLLDSSMTGLYYADSLYPNVAIVSITPEALQYGNNFTVDIHGTTHVNSIIISSDSNTSSTIDIKGNFIVDNSGNVEIKNKLKIADFELMPSDGGGSVTKTIYGTVYVEKYGNYTMTQKYIKTTLTLYEDSSHTILWANDTSKSITVGFSFRCSVSTMDHPQSYQTETFYNWVTIYPGSSSNYDILNLMDYQVYQFNEIIDTWVYPTTSVTYAMSSGMSISGSFYPSTNSYFDLGSMALKWNNIYGVSINPSDKNLKKDINYDIGLYSKLFDLLKPASYKFIDGSSNRTHLGMIAQDVEESLNELNISSKDFAGFIKEKNENTDSYMYGLRYSEFISLLIYEVQKLKKEIKLLKEGS